MDWNALVESDLLWIHENGPGEDWIIDGSPVRCWWGSTAYIDQVTVVRLDQMELHVLRSQYPDMPSIGADVTRLSDGSRWRIFEVAEYDPWIWVVRIDRAIGA